jgi:hypothetical protein
MFPGTSAASRIPMLCSSLKRFRFMLPPVAFDKG